MFKKLIVVSVLMISISLTNCSESVDEPITEKKSEDKKDENPENPEEPVKEEKTTYVDNVKSIIDNNCIQCHGGSRPRANLILEDFASVKNAAQNGNLITRMNSDNNPMPPSGKLSQSTLDIIDKWKTDGFLEKK